MSGIADAATEWGFGAAWAVVRRLPEPVADRVFRHLADRSWRNRTRGVVRLERNLHRVRPDADEAEIMRLSREGMRRYLRYYCEAFRLPVWSAQRIAASCQIEGFEQLDDLVATGRGGVVVGAHMGNWDLAGAYGALRLGTVVSVAEKLKPPGLFERFLAFRRELGMEVYGVGDPDLIGQLTREARAGKIVALVGDRDMTGNGIEVDFFGAPAPFPAGPAIVSLLSGAPLLTFTLWFDGPTMRGRIGPPIEPPVGVSRTEQVRQMTQSYADVLAAAIAEHPEDWHMLQRIWPDEHSA